MNWQEWFDLNNDECLETRSTYTIKVKDLFSMFRARMVDELVGFIQHIPPQRGVSLHNVYVCEAWWDLEIVP